MTSSIDGFYTAYLTGKAGNGFAMFVVRRGAFVGADMLGALYDGTIAEAGSAGYKVTIAVKLPPNLPLIQGGVSGPNGEAYDMNFNIPLDFLSEAFVRIDGEKGPINAKLVKIRPLDD